ncbi:formylglycine-generating enzyme family protein [Gemmata sp. JC673]|uniref:Formylglycine-generating enzyme family protein n=1 Tax=Gemmata algarum TaxID=2975278 RepID=A0ABU5EVQ0_9BACT|nr:SUMF1/EgtB/PvdO family nonheme iron enzyme [Gemmata algarum]MDY3559246.1 formylglycine-generating enzyme family protein [Gemmata algarum]
MPRSLVAVLSLVLLAARVHAIDPVTKAADGTPIPHPASKVTRTVKDGEKTVQVPKGMVYVPAGEFTFGTGVGAKKVKLDGFCIGKYHVTNAEYKAFLDATGGRAPSYWTKGTYPDGKANHPVAFVSMTQAAAYAKWVSKETGWTVALPTSEQWEKAARGPKNTLYPWGGSMDVTYKDGVLTSKFNYNGVLAAEYLKTHPTLETAYSAKSAKYGGQKVTVEKIVAYDDAGKATAFGIGATGQVRGWVAHSTNTGFIGTDLFHTLSAAGGNTTPVGTYEAGKSGYGCYDMAGNLWAWCDTKITATNGAERGKEVNEIRGGSWYATGTSCKSVSIGEGRAPAGAYNTVGFRVVMIPKE